MGTGKMAINKDIVVSPIPECYEYVGMFILILIRVINGNMK